MTFSINNIGLPSPEKFNKIKKVIGIVTNFAVAVWAIYLPSEAPTLLVIKLAQSFLMQILDELAG